MNCPNCGKEINENIKFCPSCGISLIKDDATWFSEHIALVSIIAGIFVVLLVSGVLISASHNKTANNTSQVSEEFRDAENTEESESKNNIDEHIVESQEKQPTAPKPKCIYETSDGVCFATYAFRPSYMSYYDCTGGLTTHNTVEPSGSMAESYGIYQCYAEKDYWAGAMKTCQDYGFKLPDKDELASLAKDIYGARVSTEPNVKSYLAPNMNGKQNAAPYELLFKYVTYAHQAFSFWESDDASPDKAYQRLFFGDYNISTERYTLYKSWGPTDKSVHEPYAVCVYNPYGVTKIKYAPPKMELKKDTTNIPKTLKNEQVKTKPQAKSTPTSIQNTKTDIESVENDLF